MRIAFVDRIDWDYRVDAVQHRPLGGSQSALCYLSVALAHQGHEVFLFNHTSLPGLTRGVFCLPLESASVPFLQSLDALIVLNNSRCGKLFRNKLNPRALLIFWTQHGADQPGVQSLADPTERDLYDAIAAVSDWQREQLCQTFNIDPARTFVLRNAIAPVFQNCFAPSEAIRACKTQPPVLAYTSTPFRGLGLLLQLFPEIRHRVPGTRLKVFSSMKVYQIDSEKDRDKYGHLYQQCLDTEGVDYVGSIPQPQLAEELRQVSALAYPNIFPETSCIAVMEALASGCWVVSSELGALPETAEGFGRLVPIAEEPEIYAAQFIAELVDVLTLDPAESEKHLQLQVAHINQTCIWDVRAREWSEWLTALLDRKGGVAFAPYSLAYRAYHTLSRNRFKEAVELFEEAIATEPDVVHYYWYLGLALLLDGREEEAQTTWLSVMMEAEPDRAEAWATSLAEVLLHEAQRRQELSNERVAWVLRRHVREIIPGNLVNDLWVIDLSVRLDLLDGLGELVAGVAEILEAREPTEVERDLLLDVMERLVAFELLDEHLRNAIALRADQSQRFAEAFKKRIEEIFSKDIYPSEVLARFAALGIRLQPENLSLLARAIGFYQKTGDYEEGVQLADRLLQMSTNSLECIAGFYLKTKTLLQSGNNFDTAKQCHDGLMVLLDELMMVEKTIHEGHLLSSIATLSFASYLEDNPSKMHQFRHQFANFWQAQIEVYAEKNGYRRIIPSSDRMDPEKPLKIGYLSACFSRHSVGFLSRWLFQYADRDRYQFYAYSLTVKADELQQFFIENSIFRDVSKIKSIQEIAQTIAEDDIDILVDLDSLTSTKGCGVMALKPAPIQVTWLGFDATGLPTVDYFIADPYVLPESAQSYYSEKIWRLPKTYIAVDGFEVDVPDMRRSDLEIPDDAVVYLSSQTGQKRHPRNAKLQMEILREVPNSYFLVRGPNTDRQALESFFGEIADAEGVDRSRIQYLPYVASERVHRANIAIADVVLDTYPYNGATTTLETLWMGIPVVTQVGEQFAARNSYTMLINAGVVTEGIAWTETEYVEWGIRMGKDPDLRKKIAYTLRSSRQTAPLWNGKQFTRTMEDAFRSMWQNFLAEKSKS